MNEGANARGDGQSPDTRGEAAPGWRDQEPRRDLRIPTRAHPGKRPASREGARTRPRPCRGGDRRGGGSRGRRAALEPEPGEESRAGRAGAGRPGFRKRRAVLEVSGAWALGAGIPGGPAQLRPPRAPGDVSDAPKSRPGAREGGAGSRELPPPRRVPWSRPPPPPGFNFITCEMGAVVGLGVSSLREGGPGVPEIQAREPKARRPCSPPWE